jgi:hypothetical protein
MATFRAFRWHVFRHALERTLAGPRSKGSGDWNEVTEDSQDRQNRPINLGAPLIEEGAPSLKPHASGFGTGPRGSKYDPVIDAAKGLEPGRGFVRVKLEVGTDADAALNALRTSIKRRLQDPSLKVRKMEDGDLAIFRKAV